LYRLVQDHKRLTKPEDAPLLKILHITTDFVPGTGGLERFVRDLAVHSRTLGIEPSVLCLNRIAGNSRPLPPQEVIDQIHVHRLKFLDLRYYKPVFLPLKKLKQADILHVHGIGALLDFTVATRWLHRKPIVLSTHGGIFHTSALSMVKNTYFGLDRLMVLPLVDKIVACGEADRALFAEHGVTRTITIDNGIDLSPFSSVHAGVQRVENRLLFVGRIAPNKSVDQLIRTLAEVRRRGVPATLRVIGPDRYLLNQGLRQLASDLGIAGAVDMVGELPEANLPAEYAAADLFVSASRHEGFGISTVEAMAGGAIPLLNRIPAFDYLLGNTTAPAGALCDFSSPQASADIAVRLLSTERAPLRESARHRAADFSWDRLMPRWQQVYQAVQARSPGSLHSTSR
jgi:alpha-1,3-mannosyltransferase